jgi:hypothetical protein
MESKEAARLLETLQARFEAHKERHPQLDWKKVVAKLQGNAAALRSLQQMESSGGEPDVVALGKGGAIVFCDCSAETPTGRRSLCYDAAALAARKEHKPKSSAGEMATAMGVELLTEDEYRQLQELGEFDLKTSSWLATPPAMRKLGGALFGDRRFGRVFVYHNGAESYYAARGFRGLLRL